MELSRPRHYVDWTNGIEHLHLPARRRLVSSIYLSAWLIAWCWWGGGAVINNISDIGALAFLVMWLLFVVITAVFLLGQIIGSDTICVTRGELVITRHAGPFYRTWRYSSGMIDNLRVDASLWTSDEGDGAQYFPFTKQQWGSVRFDYGSETVHLAPHVDAPEATQIAAWLRRRLLVSDFG